MSGENQHRPPDWVYVQDTLMRTHLREWQRFFDFWSGKTAFEYMQHMRTMMRVPDTDTKQQPRDE